MATKQIASNGVFQQFNFFLLFSNNSERDTYLWYFIKNPNREYSADE